MPAIGQAGLVAGNVQRTAARCRLGQSLDRVDDLNVGALALNLSGDPGDPRDDRVDLERARATECLPADVSGILRG